MSIYLWLPFAIAFGGIVGWWLTTVFGDRLRAKLTNTLSVLEDSNASLNGELQLRNTEFDALHDKHETARRLLHELQVQQKSVFADNQRLIDEKNRLSEEIGAQLKRRNQLRQSLGESFQKVNLLETALEKSQEALNEHRLYAAEKLEEASRQLVQQRRELESRENKVETAVAEVQLLNDEVTQTRAMQAATEKALHEQTDKTRVMEQQHKFDKAQTAGVVERLEATAQSNTAILREMDELRTKQAQMSQSQEALHAQLRDKDAELETHGRILGERNESIEILKNELRGLRQQRDDSLERMNALQTQSREDSERARAMQESLEDLTRQLTLANETNSLSAGRVLALETEIEAITRSQAVAHTEPAHTGNTAARQHFAAAENTVNSSDDLKKIFGIGKVLEKTLHDLGIVTFQQIANFDDDDISRVADQIGRFGDRILRDDWMGQARTLHSDKYDAPPSG